MNMSWWQSFPAILPDGEKHRGYMMPYLMVHKFNQITDAEHIIIFTIYYTVRNGEVLFLIPDGRLLLIAPPF